MEPEDFSIAELHQQRRDARRLADLCEKHGEPDGANAARAQERAVEAELRAQGHA